MAYRRCAVAKRHLTIKTPTTHRNEKKNPDIHTSRESIKAHIFYISHWALTHSGVAPSSALAVGPSITSASATFDQSGSGETPAATAASMAKRSACFDT
jgi:hypothetical protein